MEEPLLATLEQPAVEAAPAISAPAAPEAPGAGRARPSWPGILSSVFALLTVAGLATGIVLATSDLYVLATYVAWAAIAVSGAAVVLGVVGVIGRFGRGWAVGGILLGLVANPFLLTNALDLIGGLWA